MESAGPNRYILNSKTICGKSTLLNELWKIIAKAKCDTKVITQESRVYYYKLNNGKYIAIIDTPWNIWS